MSSAQPDFSRTFDSIREQLACPACHGNLRVDGAAVVCTECARRYPVVDGIPVLIPAASGQS